MTVGRDAPNVGICRRPRVGGDLGCGRDPAAGADQLPGASLMAISVAVAALFDTAAAFFLLIRSALSGSLADVVRVLASKRALAVGVCSLLGGPLFMGGYVAAVIVAGPSVALTATATYPVIGALLARPLLRATARSGRLAGRERHRGGCHADRRRRERLERRNEHPRRSGGRRSPPRPRWRWKGSSPRAPWSASARTR